jgi:hypothetical protein
MKNSILLPLRYGKKRPDIMVLTDNLEKTLRHRSILPFLS